jgi:lipopolysaccharide export system permease protein
MMMAKLGYIHPFIGAWFPVFVFIIAAFLLLKTAKT